MSKVYNNPIPVNNGVRLNGPAPLDDRLVLSDISDVYISAATPKDCILYGKIYKGAQIIVYETIPGTDKKQAVELILEDEEVQKYLTEEDVEKIMDPHTYVGSISIIIDELLEKSKDWF